MECEDNDSSDLLAKIKKIKNKVFLDYPNREDYDGECSPSRIVLTGIASRPFG